MTDDERLLERALDVSKACLLPALLFDLDTRAVHKKDFDEFRIALDDQLHLFLDILYQNGNLLRDQAFDSQLTQLRVNLLLITCEQTEANPFFQTDQKILVASLEKIVEKNFENFDDSVLKKVVETYKEGLRKDAWKKQLGMVHGFPKFCKILMTNRPKFIDADFTMFMLSVGSNLLTHYEPHFKTIGLKIYRNIVDLADKQLLKDLNIHQVIYSESFPMIRKSDDVDYNENLFEVLIHAVAIEDSVVKDSKWCKFDDLMEQILMQIGMEGNLEGFGVLLGKIVKLCGVGYGIGGKLEDQEKKLEENPEDLEKKLEKNLEELKKNTRSMNCRTLRWIKKLMELILRESSKLLNDSPQALKTLTSFHAIYILSFSNVDSSILGQQLVDFTKKFVLILMQVARIHPAPVTSFLKTIETHQKSNQDLSTDEIK
jgi:hypothetical protein